MELRSSRRRNEYKELQITLNGMGFYEEGMELQEMRQILDALQMSVTERETNFQESDIQQAIRESELDFTPSHDGRVLNSTMMSVHPNISPCSSPEISSERIVVQAEVHHPMDWSPPNERLSRKRFASPNEADDNENIPSELELINELLEPDSKRISTESLKNHETNTNIVAENINHSTDDDNTSLENSLQVFFCSLHEIHGPVSMRRIHDSGFNSTTSTFNTNRNYSNHSDGNINNLGDSVSELTNSSNDIRGPVSVRRIHDSGVNISSEMPPHSFFRDSNLNGSLNYSFQSSVHDSTSSAVNLYDCDEDSEPSI